MSSDILKDYMNKMDGMDVRRERRDRNVSHRVMIFNLTQLMQ